MDPDAAENAVASQDFPTGRPVIEERENFYRCRRLVLWRDGNLAVVSIKLGGYWLRVAEADCREMFFEDVTPDELAAVSRTVYALDKDFIWDRNDRRPAKPVERSDHGKPQQ